MDIYLILKFHGRMLNSTGSHSLSTNNPAFCLERKLHAISSAAVCQSFRSEENFVQKYGKEKITTTEVQFRWLYVNHLDHMQQSQVEKLLNAMIILC